MSDEIRSTKSEATLRDAFLILASLVVILAGAFHDELPGYQAQFRELLVSQWDRVGAIS